MIIIHKPLAYYLLNDKETQTCINAFIHLSDECSKRGNIFSPNTVFADYEISIHTAIQKVWVDATIKGCRFHLVQSL